jgi:hypothetical protein
MQREQGTLVVRATSGRRNPGAPKAASSRTDQVGGGSLSHEEPPRHNDDKAPGHNIENMAAIIMGPLSRGATSTDGKQHQRGHHPHPLQPQKCKL